MTPLTFLILLIVSFPCVIGLLIARWTRKGYMTTPKWLECADDILKAAIPADTPASRRDNPPVV